MTRRIGAIIRSPPKSAASCSLSRTTGCSYVCSTRPGSRDRMGEDFDAAGHLSRSDSTTPASHQRRMCTSAGRLASWQRRKRRSRPWALAPERIPVETLRRQRVHSRGRWVRHREIFLRELVHTSSICWVLLPWIDRSKITIACGRNRPISLPRDCSTGEIGGFDNREESVVHLALSNSPRSRR